MAELNTTLLNRVDGLTEKWTPGVTHKMTDNTIPSWEACGVIECHLQALKNEPVV